MKIILEKSRTICGGRIKKIMMEEQDYTTLFRGEKESRHSLLVWFGMLRYLGFFKTYNVVILTLKKATPKVARFLIYAVLIYAGFTFCGWLVLGPYNMKFRSIATTSECLLRHRDRRHNAMKNEDRRKNGIRRKKSLLNEDRE